MDSRINITENVSTSTIPLEMDPAIRVKAILRRLPGLFSENLNSRTLDVQCSVTKYLNEPLFSFLNEVLESLLTNSDVITLLDEIKLQNSIDEPITSGKFSPLEPGTLPSIEKLKYVYNRQLLANIQHATTNINAESRSLTSQVDSKRQMMMNLITKLEK